MTDPACGLCNDRQKYPDDVVVRGCPVHDTAHIDAAVAVVLRHEWQPGYDFSPASAHLNHQYDASCAVCRGDVQRILEVAVCAGEAS